MEVPDIAADYDPAWPAAFETIRRQLRSVIPQGWPIEHVGSTSVVGLVAKPIIDVDVVVPEQNAVVEAVRLLGLLGYEHWGDRGIAGREAFSPLKGLPYHHLYVVVDGSPAYHDHMDLRNFLRSHPDAVARYAQVKRSLASLLLVDRSRYLEGKAETIELILHEARRADGRSEESFPP